MGESSDRLPRGRTAPVHPAVSTTVAQHRRPLPKSRTTEQSHDFIRTYKAGYRDTDHLWSGYCFLIFSRAHRTGRRRSHLRQHPGRHRRVGCLLSDPSSCTGRHGSHRRLRTAGLCAALRTRPAGGGGQPACRAPVRAEHGSAGEDRRHRCRHDRLVRADKEVSAALPGSADTARVARPRHASAPAHRGSHRAAEPAASGHQPRRAEQLPPDAHVPRRQIEELSKPSLR